MKPKLINMYFSHFTKEIVKEFFRNVRVELQSIEEKVKKVNQNEDQKVFDTSVMAATLNQKSKEKGDSVGKWQEQID